MGIISGGGGGGGTPFNGGTVTNAVIVNGGGGGEGDYQEADVFLFTANGTSQAELGAANAAAILELRQDSTGGTGNPPIRYLDIATGRRAFFVTFNGAVVTGANAAPSDGSLVAGQMAVWYDQTNGASKLMVKAKQADGTVKTAAVALA